MCKKNSASLFIFLLREISRDTPILWSALLVVWCILLSYYACRQLGDLSNTSPWLRKEGQRATWHGGGGTCALEWVNMYNIFVFKVYVIRQAHLPPETSKFLRILAKIASRNWMMWDSFSTATWQNFTLYCAYVCWNSLQQIVIFNFICKCAKSSKRYNKREGHIWRQH